MKYRILTFVCLMMIFQAALAQKINVKGKVLDESGLPLPMATVVVEGTTSGVVTNTNGEYSITVETNGTLICSFIGYISQRVPVKSKSEINFKLSLENQQLEDVVVIGYGTQKRENVVGAVADISGTKLRKTGLSNLSHMIQDQLPGVFAELKSGQPGADDVKLTIRGMSTFSANEPLILVDGIIAAGGFSQIDAGEVASITVLKDAASTAIYGVSGANGVILVTTRRGDIGAPRVTVTQETTAKTVFNVPDQLGSYDILSLGDEASKNGNAFTAIRGQQFINNFLDPHRDQILYPDIDWYDELYRKIGWERNTRLNVSGGTNFVKYFASISLNHTGDVLKPADSQHIDGYYDPKFNYDKINFRTNLDFNLSKSTVLKTDISGRTELRRTPSSVLDPTSFDDVFKFIREATPYMFPKYYPAEFLVAHPDPLAPDAKGERHTSLMMLPDYQRNPYNDLYLEGMYKNRSDVLDFQVGIVQKLDFITKGLEISARANYSTSFGYNKNESWARDIFWFDAVNNNWRFGQPYNSSELGFHSSGGESYANNTRNIYYEFKTAYNRSFGLHTVDFTGVFSRRQSSGEVTVFPYYHEDWVGRLSYDYEQKYMAEFSAGYNGSEKFAPGKRFGFFPSLGLGWNMSKENFIADNFKWINNFKWRYSYGKTGSESGARFMYESGWNSYGGAFAKNQFGFPMAAVVSRWVESKIANPDATWETAYKHNFGIDLALFKNDFTLNVDVYSEHRDGIFITVPLASYYRPSLGNGISSGKIGPPALNLGETKNQGVEIVSQYRHTLASGMTYTFGGNINFAQNRTVYKADRYLAPEYQKAAGKPISYNSGYIVNGYIPNFEEAINSPYIPGGNAPGREIYADFNANGEIESNDMIPLGTTQQPLYVYGFNFGGSYKGLDLSVRFYGKGDVHYPTSTYYPMMSKLLLTGRTEHLDRWSPENPDARFPAYVNNATSSVGLKSNLNVIDASYLKLQSVTLSYTLNSGFLKRMLNVQNIQMNLSGQNLASWSKVPYGDPEGANGIGSGYGNYPLIRRYILGVNLNF